MIIASGFKVLPRDGEEVLFRHPKLLEAVVVGIPQLDHGDETVKAYIVSGGEGEPPTVEAIKEFCRLHLAPYKVRRARSSFAKSCPRRSFTKVLRRVLVERGA